MDVEKMRPRLTKSNWRKHGRLLEDKKQMKTR